MRNGLGDRFAIHEIECLSEADFTAAFAFAGRLARSTPEEIEEIDVQSRIGAWVARKPGGSPGRFDGAPLAIKIES